MLLLHNWILLTLWLLNWILKESHGKEWLRSNTKRGKYLQMNPQGFSGRTVGVDTKNFMIIHLLRTSRLGMNKITLCLKPES